MTVMIIGLSQTEENCEQLCKSSPWHFVERDLIPDIAKGVDRHVGIAVVVSETDVKERCVVTQCQQPGTDF